MKTYPIPMVPGPVKLPQTVLDVYQTNFGSADLEAEFLELYNIRAKVERAAELCYTGKTEFC